MARDARRPTIDWPAAPLPYHTATRDVRFDGITRDGKQVTVRCVVSIDRPNGRRHLNVSTVYTVRDGRIAVYVGKY